VTGKFSTSEFTRTYGNPGYSLKISVLPWAYIPGASGQKKPNENSEGGNANGEQSSYGGHEPYPVGSVAVTNFDNDDLPF
jgi:hypothetical protein